MVTAMVPLQGLVLWELLGTNGESDGGDDDRETTDQEHRDVPENATVPVVKVCVGAEGLCNDEATRLVAQPKNVLGPIETITDWNSLSQISCPLHRQESKDARHPTILLRPSQSSDLFPLSCAKFERSAMINSP